MSYNRIGNCKFFIDAVLLARQWGLLNLDYSHGDYNNFWNLNPSKITLINEHSEGGIYGYRGIEFKNRQFLNSITHCFILGHNFFSDNTRIFIKAKSSSDIGVSDDDIDYSDNFIPFYENGWHLEEFTNQDDTNYKILQIVFENNSIGADSLNAKLGDISLGWSFQMPHSPDLDLTQTFSNESITTQTTKGGHTLTNSGWSKRADWIRPAWSKGSVDAPLENLGYFQGGRRSWSLKFSFVSESSLFAEKFHDDTNGNFGIFENTGLETVDDETILGYNIKDNFIDKIFHGTNSFQNPLIFQPNTLEEEFAICRIDNKSATFNQVANNVYDVSLDIIEVW